MIALKFSDEDLVEAVKEIFRCRWCKGEGEVLNPYFESCLKSGLTPEEFYDCKFCDSSVREKCKLGEIITCDRCGGTGYEKLDWEEFLRRLMEDADDP